MVANSTFQGEPTQADFHRAISGRSDRWFNACLRITRSRELAEDAVQDALLSAWNKRHQFEQNARLETWIHRIAVNSALQLLRRQHPGVFESLETDIPDDSDLPDVIHGNEQLELRLRAALLRLSDIERVCFVLKHLEQWRLREIAEEMELTIGTVKQALFRALKKLRVAMSDMRSETA